MPRAGVTAPRRLLPRGAPHRVLPSAGAALGQAGRKWPAVQQDGPGALMFLSHGRACVTQRRMQLAVLFWCQHPRPPDGGLAGHAGARNMLLGHPPPATGHGGRVAWSTQDLTEPGPAHVDADRGGRRGLQGLSGPTPCRGAPPGRPPVIPQVLKTTCTLLTPPARPGVVCPPSLPPGGKYQ